METDCTVDLPRIGASASTEHHSPRHQEWQCPPWCQGKC
jgi:hypothetical protein